MKPSRYLIPLSHNHFKSTLFWLSITALLGLVACTTVKIAVGKQQNSESGLKITGKDLLTVLNNNPWLSPLTYDFVDVKVATRKRSVTYMIPVFRTRAFICLKKTRKTIDAYLLKNGVRKTASGLVIKRSETVDISTLLHRVCEKKNNQISLIMSEVLERSDFIGLSGLQAHHQIENRITSQNYSSSTEGFNGMPEGFRRWLLNGVWNSGDYGIDYTTLDASNDFDIIVYPPLSIVYSFLNDGSSTDFNGEEDPVNVTTQPFLDAIQVIVLDNTPDQDIPISLFTPHLNAPK